MKPLELIDVIPAAEQTRRQRRSDSLCFPLWDLLDKVCDPEIPALSLWQLGALQDIEAHGREITVTITPTYSGCPAMTAMAEDITSALAAVGYSEVKIETRLSPAWTTDWLSVEAREQLRGTGIAPPLTTIKCPRCESVEVELVSEFGSTACKALYQCSRCAELFDYFKPL